MSFGWSTEEHTREKTKMNCPSIMTVKHWDILLWKAKISSDEDITRQA